VHRTQGKLRRRAKPVARPSKLPVAILGIALVAVGFATLMVRLEVTQEGYRLSALRSERRTLEEQNRRLRLEVAQLSARDRLRALAVRMGLGPPPAGHVVMIP
jgi:cell division protein FtsL